MAEDAKTRSLFLCVMDGHGESGDKVSQAIKAKLSNYLFKHKDFANDVKAGTHSLSLTYLLTHLTTYSLSII